MVVAASDLVVEGLHDSNTRTWISITSYDISKVCLIQRKQRTLARNMVCFQACLTCLASFFDVFADEIKNMVDNEPCAEFLGAMASVVDRYFERSGRRWVDLGALFGGMQL